MSAYVSIVASSGPAAAAERPPASRHTSAYVSIRQHTSAYSGPAAAAERPPASQHTSAYVSIRQHTSASSGPAAAAECPQARKKDCEEQRRHSRQRISEGKRIQDERYGLRHTSAYVSIRQHTSAYVSIRQQTSTFRMSATAFETDTCGVSVWGGTCNAASPRCSKSRV
jgi:hypothetical protein